jgi:16S rRNA (guanine966-N2)-methyltransferase
MRHKNQKKPSTTGRIRIIAGQHRGRQLPVLDAQGLRPTTDRTKETLFNWLMQDVQGSVCLDGFAGSGSLGFEALSRGAQHVYFIEKNTTAANQLNLNVATLALQSQANVLVGEFAHSINRVAQSLNEDAEPLNQGVKGFDLIFLDPPFQQGLLIPSLVKLLELQLISPHTLIYLECETALSLNHINLALRQSDSAMSLKPIKQQQTNGFMYGLFQLNT